MGFVQTKMQTRQAMLHTEWVVSLVQQLEGGVAAAAEAAGQCLPDWLAPPPGQVGFGTKSEEK